jgi:hypothetical protein
VAELAHLPAMLDRLPAADVARLADDWAGDDVSAAAGEPGPPPSLLPDLLTRAGVVSRRRRWPLAAGLAAAAAAAVVAGALAVQLLGGPDGPPAAQRPPATPSAPASSATTAPAPVVLRPIGTQAVTAAVRLESVAWGTKIELTCAYATEDEQYPDGTPFALVVADPFGRSQQVATWNSVKNGRTLTVPAATSLRQPGITRVEVRSGGRVVLTAAP